MAEPRCAVVIPARDMEGYLAEAIASVLGQDPGDFELVVVDDGSRDGSGDVARGFRDPRLRVLRQEGAGLSAARNRGLAATTADRLVFLDADDRLCPGALARFVDALDREPDLAVAYGEVAMIDASGLRFTRGRRPWFTRRPSGDVLDRLLVKNCIVTPGAACVRRAHLARAGPFDPTLATTEDWEFWCRLALEGPFRYLGGPPVLEYRQHAASKSAQLAQHVTRSDPAIERVWGNPRIRRRYGEARLARLRHVREGGSYAHTGRTCLKAGRWTEARRCLGEALRRNPLRPREAVFWLAALLRWCPGPLRRRIK